MEKNYKEFLSKELENDEFKKEYESLSYLNNVKIGDRFILHYTGRKYPYEARKSATGDEIVLVNIDPVPLGVPLNAVSVYDMADYDFERV